MLVPRFVAALAVVASFVQSAPTVIFDRAIDDVYRARLTTVRHYGSDRHVMVHVGLHQRSAPQTAWELTTLRAREDQNFAVERATARVIVLYWRSDPYGGQDGYVKLFLDLASRRIEKRIDYEERALALAGEAETAQALSVNNADVALLRQRGVLDAARVKPELPKLLVDHSLPQSTVAAALAVRPGHTANGLDADDFGVLETIEAFHEVGGLIWFGKSFYDAEGETGLGAIGSIDKSGTYTFLRIPELALWSVGALLVEGDDIWAGLVHHGEGRDQSGGLLHHDRVTGRTVVHRVSDVVHTLVNVNGTLFAGTDRGVYAIRGSAITRYRIEPDIGGNFVVISQRL